MTRPHKSSAQFKNEPVWFSGFAHVLVRGQLSLYLIKIDDLPYFFLKLPDGNLEELVLKRQQVKVNGTSTVRDFPLYQALLERLEKDCESLKGLSKKTRFSEKDFISFASNYNVCVTGSEGNITPLSKKSIVHKGLIGGYNFNEYKLSDNYIELGTGNMATNSFAFGGFVMAYLPRGQGRWGFYYELLYKPVRMKSKEEFFQSFSYFESNNKYEIDLLKGSVLFRHSSISGKVRPFFNGGVIISIPARSRVVATYNSVGSTDYEVKSYSVKGEKGLVFGTGIQMNNLEIEARWERLDYQRTVFTKGQIVNLLVKYHFRKKTTS